MRVDVHLHPEAITEALRIDALSGLTARPKTLPPKWFYDDVGSRLFDEITRLPEYYPTRREREILEREAPAIAAWGADTLVELGAGTATKTRVVLDAMSRAGHLRRYVPFDVSEATLRTSAAEIAQRHPGVSVHAIVGDFDHHLGTIPDGGRRLVAFLGGTIGNMDVGERKGFYAELAGGLAPGDGLLLGADLVKEPERLIAAYDDAAGVTARFNRNVISVLDRELDGDLPPDAFGHLARWNDTERRIEMWLEATRPLASRLEAIDLDVTFEAGEQMRTEISCKFRPEDIDAELATAGFELVEQWTDAAGDFSLNLARLR
ncbi:MAG: L-histidine N(alpha)-methyltransferase [Actinomycetota bacterium]|nr:L-histidine N(alpha)-methyltransferase [Actinomycetota bacterium]